MERIKSTTVVAIRHNGETVIGADGQATLGNTVAKSSVKKIRVLQGGKGSRICGRTRSGDGDAHVPGPMIPMHSCYSRCIAEEHLRVVSAG